MLIYSLMATLEADPEHSRPRRSFRHLDIGCRFYTYSATMGLTLEAAGENGKKYFVLDRVNPITGTIIDGPVRMGKGTFIAHHEVPLRYAMTTGELARMYNREHRCNADLTVIQVEGWQREAWFDQTDTRPIPPPICAPSTGDPLRRHRPAGKRPVGGAGGPIRPLKSWARPTLTIANWRRN